MTKELAGRTGQRAGGRCEPEGETCLSAFGAAGEEPGGRAHMQRGKVAGTSAIWVAPPESLPSQNNRDGKAFFLSLRDKAPGALTAMEEEIMLDIEIPAAKPGGRSKRTSAKSSRKTNCPWWMKCWRWTKPAGKKKARSDYLRSQRNAISKQIGAMMAKGQREEAEQTKRQVTDMAQEMERSWGSRSVSWKKRSARGCW